jgi:hypothetical protein
MSKKLIAVAAAAALALTALVAAPANASMTFGIGDVTGDGTTAKTASTHAAPESDRLQFQADGVVTNTAVRYSVTGTADAAYTVTAAAGVKVISTVTAKRTADGLASLSGTFKSGESVVFYAYTTSTTAGTVTVASAGNTIVYYVAATPGAAYNIASVEYPASMVPGTATNVYVKLTDVFGNEITTDNAASKTVDNAASYGASQLTLTALRATVATPGTWTWDTTKKLWKSGAVTPATSAGDDAFALALQNADQDRGFAAPVRVAFKSIVTADLAAQVKTLTAQVATLTTSVTALTADYNSVAKKYNKLVKKSKRVALK